MLNDVYMLSVRGTVSGSQHIHTLHFLEGPVIGDAGEALIAAWQGAPQVAYRLLFNPAHAPILSIIARKVCGSVPVPAPVEVAPAAAATLGTRTDTSGAPQPSFIAAQVSERGSVAGRRYSGRFFLGGLYSGDVSGNDLVDNYKNKVGDYLTALRNEFVQGIGSDFQLFAYSKLLGDGDTAHTKKNPNPPPDRVADPVESVDCDLAGSVVASLALNPRVTTMRSRKLGHGL
jgi:hypothetical protein